MDIGSKMFDYSTDTIRQLIQDGYDDVVRQLKQVMAAAMLNLTDQLNKFYVGRRISRRMPLEVLHQYSNQCCIVIAEYKTRIIVWS